MSKSGLITIFSVPVLVVIIILIMSSSKPGPGSLANPGSDNQLQNNQSQTKNDQLQSQSSNKSSQFNESNIMNNLPEMKIDVSKKYQALLDTSQGVITINLHANKTPITVNNFIHLSESNFYNNTIFHRIIDGFMIQGGDPTGTGSGGPGYNFNDEPFDGEYTAGTVAMANAGPNTNGSQFFIMHKDNPLPKNYVIFGKVTDGMDVVDKIATAKVSVSNMGENSKPIEPVSIKSIEILEY